MILHKCHVALVIACLSTACSRAKEQSDSATVQHPASTPASTVEAPAWVVTPHGMGRLAIGMTRPEAEAVLGSSLTIPHDTGWSGCARIAPAQLPKGVRLMVDGGALVRIDVDSGTTATAAGARIGDSENRIQELYSSAAVTPHKYYPGGHYLTVTPTAASDSAFRIVFETDGRRVTAYRVGRMPQVAYVEGCG